MGSGGIFFVQNTGTTTLTMTSCTITSPGANINGGVGQIGGSLATVKLTTVTISNAYALSGSGGVFKIDATS